MKGVVEAPHRNIFLYTHPAYASAQWADEILFSQELGGAGVAEEIAATSA